MSTRLLQVGSDRANLLIHRRALIASLGCFILIAAVWLMNLLIGRYELDPAHIWQALFATEGLEHTVVVSWRLGRSIVAIAAGAALGLSGALTQRMAKNGLASPDILGVSQGASVAAVSVIILGVGASWEWFELALLPTAAIIGGLGTAALIWLLNMGGSGSIYRLILIGIGVNATFHAVVTYLIATTDLDTAAAAKIWMIGSLNGRTVDYMYPIGMVLIAVICVLLPISMNIQALEMGDEVARGLGVNVRRCSALVLIVSVVLSSVTVAAIGPVGFVAFVAPHIAARLARVGAPPIGLSALCGSMVLLSSDVVARTALGWEIPVGVVTAAVGGPVLLWLLVAQRRGQTR